VRPHSYRPEQKEKDRLKEREREKKVLMIMEDDGDNKAIPLSPKSNTAFCNDSNERIMEERNNRRHLQSPSVLLGKVIPRSLAGKEGGKTTCWATAWFFFFFNALFLF
jgi:hypothetical protein